MSLLTMSGIVSLTNMVPLILFLVFLALFPIYHLLTKNSSTGRLPLPPGSMGLPLIGHSLSLLRALRSNTAEKWLEDRVRRYGPISKLSLFGKPTVFIPGPTGNKLVFTSEELTHQQPLSVTKLVGTRNILELSGEEHRRVRGALVQFLKADVLKKFIEKIDGEVRHQLAVHWVGRQHVTVFWTATATHRDATIFDEPMKFDSSRFSNQSSVPPYSFVPFGGGARICPGNELARIETLVTIHYLVTRFKWKLTSKDDSYCRDLMPSPSEGLPIELVYKSDL